MAAPSVLGTPATNSTTSSVTSLAVTLDATPADGELMVANFYWRSSAAIVSPPDGTWTTVQQTNGQGAMLTAIRVWHTGDPTVYTFTCDTAVRCVGGIARVSGATTPADASAATSGTGTSMAATGVTTTGADRRVFAFLGMLAGTSGSGTVTPPATFTEHWDRAASTSATSPLLEASSAAQAVAGASGTLTATTATSSGWLGHVVAISPAGGATLSATATGSTTSTGTATASLTEAASASGATTATGTATVSLTLTAAATGAVSSTGTATARVTLTAAATGSTTSTGTAAASITSVTVWSAAATGTVTTTGTATATITAPTIPGTMTPTTVPTSSMTGREVVGATMRGGGT